MRGYESFFLLLIACGSAVETLDGAGGGSVSSSTAAAPSTNASSSSVGAGGSAGSAGSGGASGELCTTLWARAFGGTGSEYGQHLSLADGSLLLAGGFTDTIDFGLGPLVAGGETDVFLAKLDGAGNASWSTSFTSGEVAWAYPLDHDAAGNLYVGGNFKGTLDVGGGPLAATVTDLERDVFVAKLDPAGNHLWSKRFGAPGCAPGGCGISGAVSSMGELVVAITGDASLDFGGGTLQSSGSVDVFVARFDQNGNHLSSQRYGGTGFDFGFVTRNETGDLWLYGDTDGTLVLGTHTVTNVSGIEGYVAKLDPGGSVVWLRSFNGPSTTLVMDVESHGATATVTGMFEGQLTVGSANLSGDNDGEAFVVSLDAGGNVMTALSFGGDESQAGQGVTSDAAGRVLVGGQFNEKFELAGQQVQSAGWIDAYWAAFDPTGAPLGSCTYGSIGMQMIDDIEVASDGTLFIGVTEDTTDFGTGPLTSAGEWDIVVGKLAPLTP